MDKSTCDLLIRNAQIITIWEGFECEGYPVKTMLRGKVIVEEGKLVGNSSDGKWLPRKVSPETLARPVV